MYCQQRDRLVRAYTVAVEHYEMNVRDLLVTRGSSQNNATEQELARLSRLS